MTAARRQRLDQANIVLKAMGDHGRRFFYSEKKGRYARFVIGYDGHLRFIDDYTGRRIYVCNRYWRRGFSHGGTCRAIVIALKEYIVYGTPMAPGYFGPWDDHYCRGDLWGYGAEEMARVREAVYATGAVRLPVGESA